MESTTIELSTEVGDDGSVGSSMMVEVGEVSSTMMVGSSMVGSYVLFWDAEGILVNTWEDLEPKTLAALRDTKLLGRVANEPVYPIGPLARPVGTPIQRSQKLDWLDTKPSESVIYVSFGIGGSLSAKQMIKLAWGLELSQQSFVWVVTSHREWCIRV
ncbi:hypothetical protein Dsin_011085 [Dipteronia sinensis]|uniref:Uncharacterized protein n=1 Tax=Dipteronia sinensis TaxID=43782 RepID=A0AAE0AUE6_9ROSI|nr:hypothetical protein Dsin_011085 [Dipteronia sinensis]